jgi:5-formyltetrahydrofolate cyclo-ligase
LEIFTPNLSFRDKPEARIAAKQYIHSIKKSYKVESEKILTSQLCKFLYEKEYSIGSKIAFYRADSYELDLYSVANQVPDSRFFFPVVGKNSFTLKWVEAESWMVGSYGILEPVGRPSIGISEIDLFIIPGLGFGKMGHRLGRGKGYYDRALSGVKSKQILGICYEYCRDWEFPWESHDLKIGNLFTEKGRFSFLD